MRTLNHCPVCDAPADSHADVLNLDVGRDDHRLNICLRECSSCSHVYVNPQPTAEELEPFYREGYHVFADKLPDRDETARKAVAEYREGRFNHAAVKPAGRYLDVGCGLGAMVMAMECLGMEAVGVEPSEVAARRGREAGLNVIRGMLHEVDLPAASFDTISLYHVLEHTPDPIEVLRQCRRLLKPDGELVIGVPNFDSRVRAAVGRIWSALDLPRHLQHFRGPSLRRAAAAAGLIVSHFSTESLVPHVELELVGWLRRRLRIPRRLSLATRIARPAARRLSARGQAADRGEAIIVRLQRSDDPMEAMDTRA